MSAPNGFFIGGLLVYGDPPQWISKGFVVDCPDRSNSSDVYNAQFESAVRGTLGSLGNDMRLQACWSVDSDYKDEILAYSRRTKEQAESLPWSLECRTERANRYWTSMQNRTLRREKLRIYVSKQMVNRPPAGFSKAKLQDYYRKMIAEYAKEFDLMGAALQSRFSTVGAKFHPMGDKDHYRHLSEFLNPSQADLFNHDPAAAFDPWATIQENCLHSGMRDGLDHRPGYGFFLDGYYHNVLTLKRLPDRTHETLALALTQTAVLNYTITVNVYPKDRDRAVREEQLHLNRLKGDYASSQREEFVTAIELRKQRIRDIKRGSIKPLDADFILIVRAKNPDELAQHTSLIKTVIARMDGALVDQPIIFTATKKLFFQAWPGWIFGHYTAHSKYYEDIHLARLLPFSSSFNGHLRGAEALYDGPNGSLAGVKLFVNDQPQHAALFGITGSGKSAYMFDLLSQTRPMFDYLVLIEEGMSYAPLVQKLGGRSIILHPDGDVTINYLDTHGLPLTSEQIDAAATIATRMTGDIPDPEKRALRKATMTSYINLLYTRVYEDWIKFRPAQLQEIARLAMVVVTLQKHMQEHVDKDTSFIEAWAYARDNEQDLQIRAKMAAIPAGDVNRFLKNYDTEIVVRNVSFAYMKAEEMPTHSALYETLKNTPMPDDDRREISNIAKLLGAWTVSDGSHGKLFDGVTNIRLTDPVVHFELGKLRDSSEIKALAGFLVANYVRQHILSLPRSVRKGVVFEEVARFLGIPGGVEIVKEFYAQMRKFRAWVISIIQAYAQFKDSPIRGVIMGMSKQFFFMRQDDRRDLEDLCRDRELSEATRSAILNYPSPEHVNFAYSQLTYYHMDNLQPICGTLTNRLSAEVIAAEREYWSSRKTDVQSTRDAVARSLDESFTQTSTLANTNP